MRLFCQGGRRYYWLGYESPHEAPVYVLDVLVVCIIGFAMQYGNGIIMYGYLSAGTGFL